MGKEKHATERYSAIYAKNAGAGFQRFELQAFFLSFFYQGPDSARYNDSHKCSNAF
jgi:hypothetical protein